MFEAVSQARSLPRRGFQEDTHLLLRTAAMDSIDSPRKLGEARLLSRTGMGSRVGDQARNPQRLASIQLHQEGLEGLLPEPVLRRAEIDEVGIVGHYGPDPGGSQIGPESIQLTVPEGSRPPLVTALDEDLQRLAPHLLCGEHRPVDAPGNGDVRTEPNAGWSVFLGGFLR